MLVEKDSLDLNCGMSDFKHSGSFHFLFQEKWHRKAIKERVRD